jgi:hypothetical protein
MRVHVAILSLGALVLAIPAAATNPNAPRSQSSVVLDNFACYAARFSQFASRSVTLTDQFGSRRTLIGRPPTLCSPASVNGSEIHNGKAHLTCHPVAVGSLKAISVEVKNRFGALRMSVRRMELLCVASSAATGGALRPPPTTLDHFTCYSIRPRQSFPPRTVVVADPFHKSKTSDKVVGARGVCVPARVNHSRRLQHGLLVCYEVGSRATSRAVAVRSRFGLLTASPGARSQLCIRSVRVD